MDMIVDQEPIVLAEGPSDVLDALAAASESLRENGRAVLAVQVDGEAIPPDQVRERLRGMPVSEAGVLAITSEEIFVLVDDCLEELEELLPELPKVCHNLAEEFQGEWPEAGYEPFHQFARIWQTIKEREIMVTSALDLDLDALGVRGAPIAQMHRELNKILDEAADALKTGDCVLLGDLLEYELAPRAEAEIEIVALLRESAEGRRP